MNIKDLFKKKETDDNPYLKEITYPSLDGQRFDTLDEALDHNKLISEKLNVLKKETNNNPYLKDIKYPSLDNQEFDSLNDALNHNKELCEKLNIFDSEEDKDIKIK